MTATKEAGEDVVRRQVCLNVDMDTVGDILQGYGLRAEARGDAVWEAALPRLLELLDVADTKATFFVVARDAREHGGALRDLALRGHEVASHSMTHPQPFRRLSEQQREWEVRESRRALEDALSGSVLGFKAPGWDAGGRVLRAVAAAGYAYDASGFPSPMLLAARGLIWWGGEHRRTLPINGADLAQSFSRRRGGRRDGNGLARFPLATTRFLRIPVYNTMRHYLGDHGLDRMIPRIGGAGGCASFTMHAIDLLDLDRDGAPQELRRHPGLARPLGERRDALAATLGAFSRAGFGFRRFRDVVAEDTAGRALKEGS